MSFRKRLNRGFSLIELMVVIGLLGGISLVVMNITKESAKSSTKLEHDSDMTLTTNEINAILSDPAKCLATLGTTATPTNIAGKFFTTASGSAPASGYGNSQFKIASYTLSGSAPDGVLTIAYTKKNILKGASATPTIPKKINLYIEGAPGAITACRALSTSSTDIWTRGTGANSNDIFYDGGNVGVGTSTPTTKLEVNGTIRPASAVLGAACSTLGAQAYNSATGAPLYCSNTNKWTASGGGTMDCIVVSNTTAVSSNGWQATCPADRQITGGGVTLAVAGSSGCFNAYVLNPGLGGSYMCADCNVRPSSCQAICCK